MPKKPQPFKQVCKDCNWNEIVAPKSDALLENTIKKVCPKCQSVRIELIDLSVLESIKLAFK